MTKSNIVVKTCAIEDSSSDSGFSAEFDTSTSLDADKSPVHLNYKMKAFSEIDFTRDDLLTAL